MTEVDVECCFHSSEPTSTQLPEKDFTEILHYDILYLIGEYFATDKKTLRSLVLCCRRFYATFTPLLYSSVQLRGFSTVCPLFKVVYGSSELRDFISHVEFGPAEGHSFWDMDVDIVSRPEEVEVLSTMLSDAMDSGIVSEGEEAEWRRRLERGVSLAWYALFLPKLSNLKSITVHYDTDPSNHQVHDLIERASEGQKPFATPAFPFLHHAIIKTRWIYPHIAVLAPYFKMSSMRKLSIISSHLLSNSISTNTNYPAIESFQGRSTVRELQLEDVVCDEHPVLGMIQWCKELNSFVLRITSIARVAHSGLFAIYAELKKHSRTLKTIRIDTSPYTPYVSRDYVKFLGSFSDFSRLKCLQLPLPCFVDTDTLSEVIGTPVNIVESSVNLKDILPASLEKLIICKCGDVSMMRGFLPKLEIFVIEANTYTPSLRQLTLDEFPVQLFYVFTEGQREDKSSSFFEKCRKSQISFTWSTEPCNGGRLVSV